MSIVRRPAALALGAIIALAAAVPAAAHVTVNPRETPKGGFAKLTFRVPNERAGAGTVKLEIAFPAEHPIRSVGVKPRPGWTYTVEKAPLAEPMEAHGEPVTEAVSRITWTGGPIKPGEFDEFEVSAGPLPTDADRLVFKALQTYENGEVVRWIDEPVNEGEEEPEHPAPVLTLTAVSGDEHDVAASAKPEDEATDDDLDTARRFGIGGTVLGGLALVLALVALTRVRKVGPGQ